MLEPKIAVPFPDPSLRDPRDEAVALRDSRLPAASPHGVERRRARRTADERLDLREVLVDVAAHDLDRARPPAPRARRRRTPPAAPRDAPAARAVSAPRRSNAAALARPGAAACGPRSRRSRPSPPNPWPCGPSADRHDAEVDVGREPPVQAHLVLAETPARLERPEVEEPEIDRPLDLPGFVADQEHPRRMRRLQRDRQRGLRAVRARAQQIRNELGLAGHHSATPWFHG